MSLPLLRLRQLWRRFGTFDAVADLHLDIHAGEVFTLLGPSGCGKTTTLRMVAGLDSPDAGEIWVGEQMIVGIRDGIVVPPHRRNMGMVFQSYAIWPHMTVFENVAYPLRARRVPRDEISRRVAAALERVGLTGFADRPGPDLSGGQQQRVAIARALVYEPQILLLDEPFSNLDAKLREQMRAEIRTLLKGLGITVVLVTHDQLEALAMSDRIAVMNRGRIEQIGAPRDVYDTPQNPFVRDFLGRLVLLPGHLAGADAQGRVSVTLGSGGESRFQVDHPRLPQPTAGQPVVVTIRPEQIGVAPLTGRFDAQRSGGNVLPGIIETLMFAGERYEARIRTGTTTFIGFVPQNASWREGQDVVLTLPSAHLSAWPA